jgi:hypothetical protein
MAQTVYPKCYITFRVFLCGEFTIQVQQNKGIKKPITNSISEISQAI